jgi:hypothetical protein
MAIAECSAIPQKRYTLGISRNLQEIRPDFFTGGETISHVMYLKLGCTAFHRIIRPPGWQCQCMAYDQTLGLELFDINGGLQGRREIRPSDYQGHQKKRKDGQDHHQETQAHHGLDHGEPGIILQGAPTTALFRSLRHVRSSESRWLTR